MNRRRFLAALGAAGATLAADAWLVEPRRLQLTRHALDPRPSPGRLPVTLAQVSDLHLQRVGSIHRRVADHLARVRPDVVLFTGDAIDRADRLPVFAEFLALLDPRVPATPSWATGSTGARWTWRRSPASTRAATAGCW